MKMKIVIIGAGAIGSIIAAYLVRAGEDVVLIGRERQVQAIRNKGLKITGVRGEENFRLNARTSMEQEPDLAIFTVKTQDIEEAFSQNNKFLENCIVLSTQNGVQADNILSSHFEKEKMFSSIVMFGATYVNTGEVTFNFEGDWIIGKPFTPVTPETHQLADIFKTALPVKIVTDIMGMKWLKLFVNFNNCIPALVGCSMQETFADIDFCKLSVLLLKEGVDIVRKANIKFISLPSFPSRRIDGLTSMPLAQAAEIMNKTLTSLSEEPLFGSILQSIKRGRPSEINFINGEIVHLAAQMRMDSPLNKKILELVHRVEKEGKFLHPDEVKKELGLK